MYYNFEKGEIVDGKLPTKPMEIDPAMQAKIDEGISLLSAELVMEQVFGKNWKEITGITRAVKKERNKAQKKR